VLPDFTTFDTKLKSSTESLKNNLQSWMKHSVV
jgi:hypothetical protein